MITINLIAWTRTQCRVRQLHDVFMSFYVDSMIRRWRFSCLTDKNSSTGFYRADEFNPHSIASATKCFCCCPIADSGVIWIHLLSKRLKNWTEIHAKPSFLPAPLAAPACFIGDCALSG